MDQKPNSNLEPDLAAQGGQNPAIEAVIAPAAPLWSPFAWGSEFRAQELALNAASTGLKDGGLFVVHQDEVYIDGQLRFFIRGEIFNADGSSRTGTFDIHIDSLAMARNPKVAVLNDGRVVVAWADNTKGILAKVVDPYNLGASTEARNVQAGPEWQDISDVVATPGGGFTVVYKATATSYAQSTWGSDGKTRISDGTYSALDIDHARASTASFTFNVRATAKGPIFGEMYQITLKPDMPEGLALDYNIVSGGLKEVEVSSLGTSGVTSSGLVMSWIDGVGDLWIQRFDLTYNSEINKVTLQAAGSKVLLSGSGAKNLVTQSLPDGRVVLAWQSLDEVGSKIHAIVLNADGSVFLAEDLVSNESGNQYNPTISVLSDGRFVIGWMEYPPGFTMGIVKERIFDTRTTGITIDYQKISHNHGDWLYGTHYQDFLTGGEASDTLYGGTGNDTMEGRDDHDRLFGEADYDSLSGGEGNDTLWGGQSADTLRGGGGDDVLLGGTEADTFDGGAGNDFVSYEEVDTNQGVEVALDGTLTRTGEAANDTFLNNSIEGLGGTRYADRLRGDSRANVLRGNSGSDTLEGGGGNDTIQGEDDADILKGESGNDHLDGGKGDDKLHGGADADILEGGEGFDAALYDASTTRIVASLETGGTGGDAAGDEYRNIEDLGGGSAGDDLTGNKNANYIWGNAGDDVMDGRAGNDILDGGSGNDTLRGGVGNDDIYGGDDTHDVADYTSETANVLIVRLEVERAWIGDDVDRLFGIEDVYGTDAFGDSITGNLKDNVLKGNGGDDVLDGGAGGDTLNGGAGTDLVTYWNAAAGITASLADQVNGNKGEAVGDRYFEVENLQGSEKYSDHLIGDKNVNRLIGVGGNDTLEGGAGGDTLIGGIDETKPGTGDNFDYASYESAGGPVVVNMGNANVAQSGDAGGDTYYSIEGVIGSNFGDRIIGNAVANKLEGGGGNDSLEGGIGNDTLDGGVGSDFADYRNAGGPVVAYLHSLLVGQNKGDAAGDRYSNIEGLIGSSHNDTLVGSDGSDTLQGGGGDDRLVGGSGWDTLQGGSGNDLYIVNEDDAVDETVTGSSGTDDTIKLIGDYSQTSYSIWSNAAIEHLSAEDVSDENLRLTLIGNGSNNRITGHAGVDEIDGDLGDDTLAGGAGGDFYTVDTLNETVLEDVTNHADKDTVTATRNYILTAGSEVEILKAGEAAGGISLTGNEFNNEVLGNGANNTLKGAGGDDTVTGGVGDDSLEDGIGADRLDGGGDNDVLKASLDGSVDTLIGGSGNDTYHIHEAGEKIEEFEGQGSDTIRTSVDFVLDDQAYVEVLEVADKVNDSGLDLTGNKNENTLIGGNGDNSLDGGAGADSMAGGSGADTYHIDDASDLINEVAEGGIDKAYTTVSYTLRGGVSVEQLFATGTGNIGLTGNDLGNRLIGNSGDNVLKGDDNDTINDADTLEGGLGSDTYEVDHTGDQVKDTATGAADGYDTVLTTVSYSIASADAAGIEALKARDVTTTNAIDLTGNALNNDIAGNAGVNILDGGSGNDTLDGAAGSDSLVGGIGDDSLIGGSGNDTLKGGSGNDTLKGGTDDDTYYVSDDHARILEDKGEGNDTVLASVNYTLTGGSHIETLKAEGNGSLTLVGNEYDNTIEGNSVDNTLDGGAGNDILKGGDGNDTYLIDSLSDEVMDTAGKSDTIVVAMAGVAGQTTYTLETTGVENVGAKDGLDNIWLVGNSSENTVTGNDRANTLAGAGGNDTLDGRDGNDSLDGGLGDDSVKGGKGDDVLGNELTLGLNTGIDTLDGGDGNDTYYIDDPSDNVIETSTSEQGGTNDIVYTKASYALYTHVTRAGVENLTALGTTDINLTGNALGNILTGNGGKNQLDGFTGADTMVGGRGDDTYVVDDAGDVVDESTASGGGGIDTVATTVSFTLGEGVDRAYISYTIGNNGHGDLIGNELRNNLTGSTGDNILNGMGGADNMSGGDGNDTYHVDNVGDVVTEAGDGKDTVVSSISYSLVGRDRLENLTAAVGAFGIRLMGNSGNNELTGNDRTNTLEGGVGNDTINGGTGAEELLGQSEEDSLSGGGGNDTLSGGHDNDILDGGADNDTLNGDTGDDRLTGGVGDDTLRGGAGTDALAGGTGDDTYYLDETGDSITENAGEGDNDRVFATAGGKAYILAANVEHIEALDSAGAVDLTGNDLSNTVTGNGDANILLGLDGADKLVGNGGNDELDGGTEADELDGGNGDDTLKGASGNDVLKGGAGNDTYYADRGDTVEDASGDNDTMIVVEAGIYDLANYPGIENLTAGKDGNGVDVENIHLIGDNLANILIGNDVSNTLEGGGGSDLLEGGGGSDILKGGSGNDVNTLKGGSGDDTYHSWNPSDIIEEGLDSGTDTLVAMAAGTYTAAANIEDMQIETGLIEVTLIGNDLANELTGNGEGNTLVGGVGNDTLYGHGGADSLEGGADDDLLEGGSGDDKLYGGDGHDRLLGGDDNDTLFGGLGSNRLEGENGNDSLIGGSGNDTLWGGDGDDTLDGGVGEANTFKGGAGNDVYYLRKGDQVEIDESGTNDTAWIYVKTFNNDAVEIANYVADLKAKGIETINYINDLIKYGGDGPDVLEGEEGNDTIYGGKGNDTLSGHKGDDVLYGEEGNDSLSGGEDNDILHGGDNDDDLSGGDGDDVLNGDSGNDTLDGGAGSDTLRGGEGDDVYYIRDTADSIEESTLEGGGFDTAYIFIDTYKLDDTIGVEWLEVGKNVAFGIEITGNKFANTIVGGIGNDTLIGGDGNDSLRGGAGDDRYVTDGADIIVEDADSVAGGTDTVVVSGSGITYMADIGIEILEAGAGAQSLHLKGNELDNVLEGNENANNLEGGAGDDTYYTYGLDIIIEDTVTGGGTDTIVAMAADRTYTAAAGIENMEVLDGLAGVTLIGNEQDNTLTGNDEDNTLDGGAGADELYGGEGNDILKGGSGDGFNTLKGGAGDDTYHSWNPNDVIEDLSGDNDTLVVMAAGTYTAAAGIENMRIEEADLIGVELIGNDLANELTGNNEDNTLKGGLGNDMLVGGYGKDKLYGDGGNDILIGGVLDPSGNPMRDGFADEFYASAGDDIYYMLDVDDVFIGAKDEDSGSDKAYILSDRFGEVPNPLDIDAYVNELHDKGIEEVYVDGKLWESSGGGDPEIQISQDFVDELAGDHAYVGGLSVIGGTAGVVYTYGLNDARFYIDQDGFLRVKNGILLDYEDISSHTLEIELFADGITKGTFSLTINIMNIFSENALGTADADLIKASSGDDVLDGGGGNDTLYGSFGSDVLRGGAGEDVFVFDTMPNETNVDILGDFNPNEDKIHLSQAVFQSIEQLGELTVDAFTIGAEATSEMHRIIYDSDSGVLMYDYDGNGDEQSIVIAYLDAQLSLSHQNFFVI